MCGVIGVSLKNVTIDDINAIESLFKETQIRGRHATGVSFLINDKVVTHKAAMPVDEFLALYPIVDWIDDRQNINAIGHCRYSTSDLKYNQPIGDDLSTIVHNGVISQEPPESWKERFGIDTETANDSELLYKRSNIDEWPDSSISALVLSKRGIMDMRNGKRPLWRASLKNGLIWASTEDIINRSLFEADYISKVEFDGDDLQP